MSSSIVVIDSRVQDGSQLAQAWQPAADVVLLDRCDDPLRTILALVEAHGSARTLHIVSHGAAGEIELGGVRLDTAALERQADVLGRIGQALGDDAAVLLYGCEVAAGHNGDAFLDRLADLTGADVAASPLPMGAQSLGGHWQLEAWQGAGSAMPLPRVDDWMHTLPLFQGGADDDSLVGAEADDTLIGVGGGDTLIGGGWKSVA